MKSLLLTGALGVLLMGCSASPGPSTAATPAAAAATPAMAATPGAVTYTCSMHPEVVSDKPGKCPKCNMDLVVKK